MTKNFTDDYADISSFHVQQFSSEKTRLGKILWYIWLSNLVTEKKNEICIALWTTHENNHHAIYTPFNKNLTNNDREIVYQHINDPQTHKAVMLLMTKETIDTLHAIEKDIHSDNSQKNHA